MSEESIDVMSMQCDAIEDQEFLDDVKDAFPKEEASNKKLEEGEESSEYDYDSDGITEDGEIDNSEGILNGDQGIFDYESKIKTEPKSNAKKDRKRPLVIFELCHEEAKVPKRSTTGAAGYDICSIDTARIFPGKKNHKFRTGLRLKIEKGFCGKLHSRSGLAREGVSITNGTGVIDEDFRGTIAVKLSNESNRPYKVTRGDKIAQIVFQQYEKPLFIEASKENPIGETERGEGGFGSTGK